MNLFYTTLSMYMTFLISRVPSLPRKVAEAAAQIHLLSVSSHNVAAHKHQQQLCVTDVSACGFRHTPDVKIRKLFLVRRRNNSHTARCKRVFSSVARWLTAERVGAVYWSLNPRRARAPLLYSRAGSCWTLPTRAPSAEMTSNQSDRASCYWLITP